MLSPNQVLNRRYRIVEKCGKGGMGTVYKAQDERLAITVAIKQCAFDQPFLRQLFTQEARLVARLRHRAIARVIDHFDEDDCQYLVMLPASRPCCGGVRLTFRMRRSRRRSAG